MYEDLVKNKREFTTAFKLTREHLHCYGQQRMSVSKAAQLISHTTATNLRLNYSDSVEAVRLADTIEIMSNWFDIFNSRKINQTIEIKKPYGFQLERQIAALDLAYNTITKMRTISKSGKKENKMQVFQKAILFSINSLKELFKHLQEKYNVTFLLTYKLNQDFLENLFSQVRSNGTITNPTPLQALHKLRLIILGKSLQSHLKISQNSLEYEDDEDFLVTQIFQKCLKDDKVENVEESVHYSTISSISTVSSIGDAVEDDAFEYVMGYLARKYKDKFPELGLFTHKATEIPELNFTHTLSYGGLTTPSEDFFSKALRMEKMFKKIHEGNKDSNLKLRSDKLDFRHRKDVVEGTIQQMKPHFPDIEEDILTEFVKIRTNIRKTHMNKSLAEDNYERLLKRKSQKGPVTNRDIKKIRQHIN
jgi:hypothetical protein